MGAATSALSVSAVQAVAIGQQWHQLHWDETWSRRGYNKGLQSMRIDILNTVREEMRDQVTVIVSSLDNMMVVATLMLSIGFGFVVEGTFPPSEESYQYSDVEQFFLLVYAILSALSLAFPLGCLMLTMATRLEVEICQQDVMVDLQRHLVKALQKDQGVDQHQAGPRSLRQILRGLGLGGLSPRRTPAPPLSPEPRVPRPRHLPPEEEPAPALDRGAQGPPGLRGLRPAAVPRGASDLGLLMTRHGGGSTEADHHSDGRNGTIKLLGFLKHGLLGRIDHGLRRLSLDSTESVGQIAEDEVRLLAEGVLEKVRHYHALYPIAQLLLWLGIHCCVLTCCVLLGLYFQANFPSTPWMWRTYSGMLAGCAAVSMCFLFWMEYLMLKEPEEKAQLQRALSRCSLNGFPATMDMIPEVGVDGADGSAGSPSSRRTSPWRRWKERTQCSSRSSGHGINSAEDLRVALLSQPGVGQERGRRASPVRRGVNGSAAPNSRPEAE